jgi:hypothetical protein
MLPGLLTLPPGMEIETLSTGYSSFGIGVDRMHSAKWHFHQAGVPRRQVFVCGVEENATF